MKIVQRISKAKFKIATPAVSGGELLLDFNPVIDKFDLTGDYYLIHWQARPRGHREYGVYSSRDDSYYSTEHINASYGCMKCYQLDDKTATTVPSAVIWFRGSISK